MSEVLGVERSENKLKIRDTFSVVPLIDPLYYVLRLLFKDKAFYQILKGFTFSAWQNVFQT